MKFYFFKAKGKRYIWDWSWILQSCNSRTKNRVILTFRIEYVDAVCIRNFCFRNAGAGVR